MTNLQDFTPLRIWVEYQWAGAACLSAGARRAEGSIHFLFTYLAPRSMEFLARIRQDCFISELRKAFDNVLGSYKWEHDLTFEYF